MVRRGPNAAAPAVLLGEVVYLDAGATRDLVSAVEGGLFLTRTDRSRSGAEKSGLLNAVLGPVTVGGRASRSSSSEREETFQSSPVGYLARLYANLSDLGLVSAVIGSDSLAWSGIREGEFIECRVRIEVSAFHGLLEQADQFLKMTSSLSELMGPEKKAQSQTLAIQVEAIRVAIGAQGVLPTLFEPSD